MSTDGFVGDGEVNEEIEGGKSIDFVFPLSKTLRFCDFISLRLYNHAIEEDGALGLKSHLSLNLRWANTQQDLNMGLNFRFSFKFL